MTTPKNMSQKKIIWIVMVFGIVAFIVYMFSFVDIPQVLSTLSKANLVIYSGAFMVYILYSICSTMVWHMLLNNLSLKITRRKAFLYTWTGLFFDATIPQLGWSAEVSKTYLLSREGKMEIGKISASVVGQKILTLTMTVVGLSIGLFLVIMRFSLPAIVASLISLVLIGSLLTLIIVIYASIKPTITEKILKLTIKVAIFFRKKWNPQNFTEKAKEKLHLFHQSMQILKATPKSLVQPIILSILGFIFEVSVVAIAFMALGQPLPIDVVLIVFTITGTLQTIGVAFFGFPELIMTLTLEGLGINLSVAVSVALLTRFVNLWFKLVISYIALQWTGLRIIRMNKTNDR